MEYLANLWLVVVTHNIESSPLRMWKVVDRGPTLERLSLEAQDYFHGSLPFMKENLTIINNKIKYKLLITISVIALKYSLPSWLFGVLALRIGH